MTKEEQKQWDDAYAQLLEHDRIENEKKDKCLDYVKTKIDSKLYNDIIECIKDCGFTDQFEITKTKPNLKTKQSLDYEHLKEVFIDQYCNGGYVGDEFAGWGHIYSGNNEYLKFHYSM